MDRGTGLIATALLLTAGVVAAADYLSGDELKAAIAGHTLIGEGWAEYYGEDGMISGKARTFGMTFQYVGTWHPRADRICYDYDGTSQDTCSQLKREGDVVYHYTLQGQLKTDGKARRVAGNVVARAL